MTPDRLVSAIYFLSGAAALLYEVAWLRLLTLHLGQTEAAVSTVLGAFLGGLALGAALSGRSVGRLSERQALHFYATLEVLIAVCALAVPTVLMALRPWLASAYADGAGGAWFGMVRLISSLIVLLVPTAAMGATYPALVRWSEARAGSVALSAGRLYAVNTIGGAVGAALAGFWLLPALGLRATTWIGLLLNLLAAAGALAIAQWLPVESATEPPPAKSPAGAKPAPSKAARRNVPTPPRPLLGLAATLLAISGCVALVYEVAWTRLLALVIGPTTYAFSAMLVAFITGIGLGAALGTRLAARLPFPATGLAACLMLTTAACLGAAWSVPRLPLAVASVISSPEAGFVQLVRTQALIAVVVLLPMAMAFGAAFPLAIAAAAPTRVEGAARVALLYTTNTVGSILGALAGGFMLIPLLGLRQTILVMGAMACIAGAVSVLALQAPKKVRSGLLVLAGIVLALGFLLPDWNPRLLSSGAYKYAVQMDRTDLQSSLEAGALLYYEEGLAGTVSVRRLAGTTSLAIDGKVDASNGSDMLTQKLLAHVPLLLHPRPRDIGLIGLGSGVTLGAALRHPISRADAVEISPEVVEASSYFSVENHGALSDPRTHLIIGDGRTHLTFSTTQYDVIVSEPSNPWMAGVATMFTREVFEAAKNRLRPGGVFCQWAHTYDISEPDLQSVVGTFVSVFPEASLWLVGDGDVLLVGSSNGSVRPLLQTIHDQWDRPGVAPDLAEVSVRDPRSLLSLWIGDGDLLATYAANAVVQTDDWTPLEFSAPRAIVGRTRTDNAEHLRTLAMHQPRPPLVEDALTRADAASWRNRGLMLLKADAAGAASRAFERAAREDPNDREALDGLAQSAVRLNKTVDAITFLDQLSAAEPTAVTVRVALSRLLASTGQSREALEAAEAAVAGAPDDPRGLDQLASILADLSDAPRLATVVAELKRRFPTERDTAYYDASLQFLRREFARAISLAEEYVASSPDSARAHNLLGAAYASLGNRERARVAFQTAIRTDPRDPTSYTNFGFFELEGGSPTTAAGLFSEALTLAPSDGNALNGLARAFEQLGQTDRAARLQQKLSSLE